MREENGFFPFLLNLCMEIRKKWKAHLSWGVMAGKVPLIEMSQRRRHFGPLFVRRAGGLRGLSLSFLTLKHLLLFLGITQQSTSSDQIMSDRSHHHNPAAHSWPTPAERKAPSLNHRPDLTANPTISFSSVPRQWWVPNHGKQTSVPLSSKRGTDESRAFS